MIAVPPTLAPFESDFPVRAVTHGPKHHFFGYYDKTCWDGSGRSVLCLEVDFIDRPPTAADSATVGVVDLAATAGSGRSAAPARGAGSRVRCSIGSPCRTPPGTSPPATRSRRRRTSSTTTVWRRARSRSGRVYAAGTNPPTGGARFVAVVRDALTGAVVRTLPRPIYALSRDGRQAVTLNFARLQHQRPGYGYPGVPDPWRDVPEPEG